MSYSTIAVMAYDRSLTLRMTAAAAQEKAPAPFEAWVANNRWQLASQPGWDAAWDSAVAGGIPDPGNDPGVITDGMILSAVQSLLNPPPIVNPEP